MGYKLILDVISELKDCIDIIFKICKRGIDDFIGLNKVYWKVILSGCFFGFLCCYMYK